MDSSSRSLTLTERRAEELRWDIALTARDLFLADRSTSVTVERICEAVGIAPRTFHRHFSVKEDVVMPLFRQFGKLSIDVLADAAPDTDTVEVLLGAFSTEVPRRGRVEIDRTFMTLMICDPQYRLRWLDWGQELVDPITEFLASRYELGADPFMRELPAQLVIQTCRYAYVQWVEHGDFAQLQANLKSGLQMIVRQLPTVSRR